jgi:uncharacterized protein YyaL (SSP411 family)
MVGQTQSALWWVLALLILRVALVEAQAPLKIDEAAVQRAFKESLTRDGGSSDEDTEELNPDIIDEQVARVRGGDVPVRRWIEGALARGLRSVDPVWGGAYRANGRRDLEATGYDKPLELQASYISVYSNASILFQNNRYRDVAIRIAEYALKTLRANEGYFFDKQSGRVGPHISVAEYFSLRAVQREDLASPVLATSATIRPNALMVQALCELYATSLDQRFLDAAKGATAWLSKQHPLRNQPGSIVGDTMYDDTEVAAAMLSLYSVTADRSWLIGATDRLLLIAKASRLGSMAPSAVDSQIRVVRIFNRAAYYSGRREIRDFADNLSGALHTESLSGRVDTTASLLLMLEELRTEPAHLTVVGGKDDGMAKDLWLRSLRLGVPYSRREWLDRREGPLSNTDTQFPQLSKPAAFLCVHKRCSLPLFTDGELSERIEMAFPHL